MGLLSKLNNLFSKKPPVRDFDQSSSMMQNSPSDWALPPLSARDVEAVLSQSEYAALEATPQDGSTLNPHPPGSREHRLWADNFSAVRNTLKKPR